jgi:conjugative transposon TraM protein
MQTHSPQFLRQRKFLLALPLLIVPFLGMFFWALGGGKGDAAKASTTVTAKGLNTRLPDAHIAEDKGIDKMSIYQQADKDSVLFKQEMQTDPYYKDVPVADKQMVPEQTIEQHSLLLSNKNSVEANEQKVNEKLAQLQAVINQPSPQPARSFLPAAYQESNSSHPDITRLEKMMQTMKQDSGDDQEMYQLNTMMDKILDMQHPERVNERTREQSLKNKQETSVVTADPQKDSITLLLAGDTSRQKNNGFYSLDDNNNNEVRQNAIEAIVPETQTLVAGATVKLLLPDEVSVNGVILPRYSLVYGTASLNNERLHIHITSVRHQNNILPVSLEVYDMDGLEGIYIPGSINRDVAKESSGEAVNSLGVTTLDPSLGAQAAGAGIQAAKTLISKKVKQIKVTIQEGYHVLLKDSHSK